MHARRLLVVEVTINRHQRRPGALDPESLATSLRQLCHEDAQNSFARCQLVQLLYRRAVEIRTQMRATFGPPRDALRDELARHCRECADHADYLLDEIEMGELPDSFHALADEARRREIEDISQRVRRHRS